MKNFIKLSLCALILFTATSNVWGWDIMSGKIYFDNSQWKWNDVYLQIKYNGENYEYWTFTKIEGSDYWVTEHNGWNGVTWWKFYQGDWKHTSDEKGESISNTTLRCFNTDNQGWTLVGPKNVGITNTTTTQGGSGTQSDPYIVAPGTKITVQAQGEKIDNNHTLQYRFSRGSDLWGTNANNTVVNPAVGLETYSVKASVRTAYNSNYSRAFDSNTLYYTVSDPCPSCKFINK